MGYLYILTHSQFSLVIYKIFRLRESTIVSHLGLNFISFPGRKKRLYRLKGDNPLKNFETIFLKLYKILPEDLIHRDLSGVYTSTGGMKSVTLRECSYTR